MKPEHIALYQKHLLKLRTTLRDKGAMIKRATNSMRLERFRAALIARKQLAKLAPDGRSIGKAVRAGQAAGSPRGEIIRLINVIRCGKHRMSHARAHPNRILRTQLDKRTKLSDIPVMFRIVLEGKIGERVELSATFILDDRAWQTPYWSVSATWKPVPLEAPNGDKLLLLSREYVGSVPFGKVYWVRFTPAMPTYKYAVEPTHGNKMRLIKHPDDAAEVAEELFAEHYAKLAGV